jgi:ADP-ribosyl-[dinitrogen reductase] hydrolase
MTRFARTASPLHIDSVDAGNGARLGMSHCPGRRRSGVDSDLRADLRADLQTIRDWGASTLLSLVEADEFARLGVPDFAAEMARSGLLWLHVPIVDMQTPGESAMAAWREQRGALRAALQRGDKVLVHCAYGLGRTGTLVARLLVERGVDAGEAIERVRRARPGTIETAAQAAFVRHDRLFTLHD